jgi:hypothetical protein
MFLETFLSSRLEGVIPPTVRSEQSSILSAPAFWALIAEWYEFAQISNFMLFIKWASSLVKIGEVLFVIL